MIDVCLLGCGGSMPVPNRALTSLLVSISGRKILIDCGEGTQVSMKILGSGFKKIDTICLTHYHADHVMGLPGLLLTIANSGRTEPINVIGPLGLGYVMKGLLVVAENLPYQLNLIEVEKGNSEITFNDMVIRTIACDHTIPCLGYSIETIRKRKFDIKKANINNVPMEFWSKLQSGEEVNKEGKVFLPDMVLGKTRKGIKICYATDTRPINKLIDFIKDSDLFVCEGMYGENEEIEKAKNNRHMIFREAAELARTSSVKELWLTHFSPSLTEPEMHIKNAKEIFENVKVGQDRLCKCIKYI